MPNPRCDSLKKFSGFSLIELLLAMTISIVVLGGLSAIFLMAYRCLKQQSDIHILQENARLISHILSTDVHLIGYVGCIKLTNDFPVKNFQALANYSSEKMKSGSDGMTISHASVNHANLYEEIRDFSVLHTTLSPPFSKGNTLLISDCQNTELFKISNVHITSIYQKITLIQPLKKKYEKSAEISRFEANTYFIGKTTRKNLRGEPVYALFLKTSNSQEELMEGVEEMKIKVNLRENNSILEKPISQLKDDKNIVGVSIQLTLVDVENPTIKENIYVYAAIR